MTAHRWHVYDGATLILDVADQPGPILSTASLPPGVPPRQHPFLSASARSAVHENRLHSLLEAAKDLPGFLASLIAAGFRVEPDAAP
jgi:hypothetical protein